MQRVTERNIKMAKDAGSMTVRQLAQKYQINEPLVRATLRLYKVKAQPMMAVKKTHCKCGELVYKGSMCRKCHNAYMLKRYHERKSASVKPHKPIINKSEYEPEPITDPRFLALKERFQKSLAKDKEIGLSGLNKNFGVYETVRPKSRYSRL